MIADSNEGSYLEDGSFTFELSELSYTTGLKVLNFVKHEARFIIENNLQRERVIAQR